jgi:type IV pilus assembly protein PilW
MPERRRPTTRRGEQGLTLVEMMVAMALALLVISVTAVVFAGTSRNRAVLERASRLNENAQYALDLLEDELRVAGYYGELSLAGAAWTTPSPCAANVDDLGWARAPFNTPMRVTGYRFDEVAPECLPHRKAGTAVLVIRRVSVDPTPRDEAKGTAYLQVSKCDTDPMAWVVSDRPGDFVLRKLDCATPADVRRELVRTYFVADCDECGLDTTATLKRAELGPDGITVVPLAEGIENLQVEYGFDGDGDGTADRFLVGPDATLGAAYGDWSNVVAARLYVLARTTTVEPGYHDDTKRFNLGPAGYTDVAHDGYKRLLLTSRVRLNNVAGARETP